MRGKTIIIDFLLLLNNETTGEEHDKSQLLLLRGSNLKIQRQVSIKVWHS